MAHTLKMSRANDAVPGRASPVLMPPAEITVTLAPAQLMRLPPPRHQSCPAGSPARSSRAWLVSGAFHFALALLLFFLAPILAKAIGNSAPNHPLRLELAQESAQYSSLPTLVPASPERVGAAPVIVMEQADILEVEYDEGELESAASHDVGHTGLVHITTDEAHSSIDDLIARIAPLYARPETAVPPAVQVHRPTTPPAASAPSHGPRLLKTPKPAYPDSQRRSGHTAIVHVRVWVDEAGNIRRWEFLPPHAHRDFEQAVTRSLREAAFSPATTSGEPTNSSVRMTFEFRLR